MELLDVEGEKHVIELVNSDKYLEEVIQSEGKNKLNIQERKKRGLAVTAVGCRIEDYCLIICSSKEQ